jgi:hypothetical protein
VNPKPSVIAHTEAGRSWVWGQPGLHSETLSQHNKNKTGNPVSQVLFYSWWFFKLENKHGIPGGKQKQGGPWGGQDSAERWENLFTLNLWDWTSRAGFGEKMELTALTLQLLPLAWTTSRAQVSETQWFQACISIVQTWHFLGSGLITSLWLLIYLERFVLSLVLPSPIHLPPSDKLHNNV